MLRFHWQQVHKQPLEVVREHLQNQGVFRCGFDVSVLPAIAIKVCVELNKVIESMVNTGLCYTPLAEVDDLTVVFDIGGILKAIDE